MQRETMYLLQTRRARYFTLSSQLALLDNAQLDESYCTIAARYRSIIVLFLYFFAGMRGNKQKDTRFPHAKLTRLLKETGFLSGQI